MSYRKSRNRLYQCLCVVVKETKGCKAESRSSLGRELQTQSPQKPNRTGLWVEGREDRLPSLAPLLFSGKSLPLLRTLGSFLRLFHTDRYTYFCVLQTLRKACSKDAIHCWYISVYIDEWTSTVWKVLQQTDTSSFSLRASFWRRQLPTTELRLLSPLSLYYLQFLYDFSENVNCHLLLSPGPVFAPAHPLIRPIHIKAHPSGSHPSDTPTFRDDSFISVCPYPKSLSIKGHSIDIYRRTNPPPQSLPKLASKPEKAEAVTVTSLTLHFLFIPLLKETRQTEADYFWILKSEEKSKMTYP